MLDSHTSQSKQQIELNNKKLNYYLFSHKVTENHISYGYYTQI